MRKFTLLSIAAAMAAIVGAAHSVRAGETERFKEPTNVEGLVFQTFAHDTLPEGAVDGSEFEDFELLHYLSDAPTVYFKQEDGTYLELVVVEQSGPE